MRRQKKKHKKSNITNLLVAAATTLLAILLIEATINAFSLDAKAIKGTLYYQQGDMPVHQVSEDDNILLELKPNSRMTDINIHELERKYSRRTVNINKLGFRGAESNASKLPGVTRIIIFGGSNTYGAAVSDEDTYPAQIQQKFDKIMPGKVEVWNGGISATVLSQQVSLAERSIRLYEPDIIILQVTNPGRRPFLNPYPGQTNDTEAQEIYEENIRLLKENKELYLENLPLLAMSSPLIGEAHYTLLRISGIYRTLIAEINYLVIKDYSWGNPMPPAIANRYYSYGDRISKRAFDNFVSRNPNATIVIFYPPPLSNCDLEDYYAKKNSCIFPPFCSESKHENVKYFFLCKGNRSDEYFHIHPPSYVYDWYAEELVDWLLTDGIVMAQPSN